MSKENYEEAKKFVLQNCYDYVYKTCNGEFYKEPLFESEVCPFAFKSYLKYPFFNPENKSGYNIFYYWQPDRNGEKGPYNSKELSQAKYIKVIDEKLNEEYVENIDDVNLKNIGNRRWKRSMKGCFFSKDNIAGRKRDQVELESLDLSADILTSIKTVVNKIQPNKKFETIERDFKLQKFNESTIKKYFDGYDEELKTSLFNFCRVCGTIGNMCPFPENTNSAHGNSNNAGDNYYMKLKKIEEALEDDSEYLLLDLAGKDVVKKSWSYFLHNDLDCNNRKNFIEILLLQDFYTNNFGAIIKPRGEDKDFYPNDIIDVKNEKSVNEWIKWLDFNTCLILKRGARIYSEGCEEKRKKLAASLIEALIGDKKLKEWYKDNWKDYKLEELTKYFVH